MTPIIVPVVFPADDTPPADVDIPHLQFPFTITHQSGGTLGANVVEQDSLADVFSCVETVVACPVGAWADQPGFGIPSQLFAQMPVGTGPVTQAITRWEPRATVTATEQPITAATISAINDPTLPEDMLIPAPSLYPGGTTIVVATPGTGTELDITISAQP